MQSDRLLIGTVQSLHQYPVKSMQGVELQQTVLSEAGLLGDRAYGLVDLSDGAVVSAKNPRKWPALLDYRAEYVTQGRDQARLQAVRITLPNGNTATTDQPDIHRQLSESLGRRVELAHRVPSGPFLQQLWPDEGGNRVTTEAMPSGSFFDLGALHLLTTSTLESLRRFSPGSHFHARRFRPNVVIATLPESRGFVEQSWIGHEILVGDCVRLRIAAPTTRCVMTTLRQPGLEGDQNVLRSVAKYADGNVGVYTTVLNYGVVRRDDKVWLSRR